MTRGRGARAQDGYALFQYMEDVKLSEVCRSCCLYVLLELCCCVLLCLLDEGTVMPPTAAHWE